MDIERLKKTLVGENIDISDERFVRAFRKFQNPAGCEDCGANTKIAVAVAAKGKTPAHTKTACCSKKIG